MISYLSAMDTPQLKLRREQANLLIRAMERLDQEDKRTAVYAELTKNLNTIRAYWLRKQTKYVKRKSS